MKGVSWCGEGEGENVRERGKEGILLRVAK